MKKKYKIIIIICLGIFGMYCILFSNPRVLWAAERQFCTCTEPPGGYARTQEECISSCRTIVEGDVGEIPYIEFRDTSSAGTPDPTRGGSVPCTCSFVALQNEGDPCAVTLYTCSTEGILSIEVGSPCANQENCKGSGGTCGATRCFCDMTRLSCQFKLDINTPCQEDYQCHSGACSDRGGSLPEKRCHASSPREDQPQPTESDLFPTFYLKSPIGGVTGPELIGRIIKTALSIVGALALAMFVYGGFTWLTSGGSADKIEKGKNILMWATIGLVVIFASYTLVDFLLRAFGL